MRLSSGFAISLPMTSGPSLDGPSVAPDPSGLFLLSREETKRLIVGSLVFALVFFYPIFYDDRVPGPVLAGWLNTWPHFRFLDHLPADGDRDVFMQLRWVPYYTLRHFHQFPFWNPYKCGGMTLIGNPEGAVVTPFVLFYLLFGMSSGVLLEICLHIAIAFAGGYVLGKELGLRPIACIALAGMFPSSSWLPLHVGAGHLNFLSVGYTPWVVAFLLAALRMKRWYPAMLGGLLCALSLTEGNYGFVFAAMLVAILSTILSLTRLSVKPLMVALVIGVFALAFSATKLMPTAELLSIYPRDWGISFHDWSGVVPSIFSRNQDLTRHPTASFFFSEYGGYVGAPFALLAIIGVITGRLKAIPWVLGTYLFLMMYRGDTNPNAPTMWLRLLPLGGNVGLCGRWVIPLVFCVGVLAAMGANYLCSRPEQWGGRLATVLVVVGLIDAWFVCAPNYRYLFRGNFPPPFTAVEFTQYWGNGIGGMTSANEANLGAVRCTCCAYYPPRGSVRGYDQPGYRGEYYLLGPGEVKQTQWTPNRLSYTVNAPAATSLVINQNMYPGWRITHGDGSVYAYDGLIAIRVPAGQQQIILRYAPRGFPLACVITFVAFAILIVTWLVEAGSPLSRRPA